MRFMLVLNIIGIIVAMLGLVFNPEYWPLYMFSLAACAIAILALCELEG